MAIKWIAKSYLSNCLQKFQPKRYGENLAQERLDKHSTNYPNLFLKSKLLSYIPR